MVEWVRVVTGAHPEVVRLTLTHRHSSPSLLRWSETVLEIFDGAGLRGPQRAVALRGLLGYVIGAIQLEHLGPLSGTGTTTMAQLLREDSRTWRTPPGTRARSGPTRSSARATVSC
jgi:hypothetical protein